MKKLLLAALCVLLIVVLAVPALAAGSVTLSSNAGTTVYRDGEFVITVSASGFGACTTGSAEVTCGNAFTLTGGEWVVANPDISYFDVNAREGGFGYATGKDVSGNVLKLKIKVKSNAPFASDKITVVLTLGGNKVTKVIDITVACYHAYGAWTKNWVGGHSRTCSICGNMESQEHSFVNECDTTCDDCGTTREITHQFGEDWLCDETGHWHACTICETRSDEAEHIPGDAAGEYTDQTCTVCGYVLSTALGHTHRYGDAFLSDENGHWKTCIGKLSSGKTCGEPTEIEAHTYDSDCDDTCDECGYTRQITHKHGDWMQDADYHWKTCTDCGVEELKGEHIWDTEFVKIKVEATIEQPGIRVLRCTECMAEREEEIPQLESPDPFGGLIWWIWLAVGAGGGILLTAIIYTLIIVIGVNRKRGGRFSGRYNK